MSWTCPGRSGSRARPEAPTADPSLDGDSATPRPAVARAAGRASPAEAAEAEAAEAEAEAEAEAAVQPRGGGCEIRSCRPSRSTSRLASCSWEGVTAQPRSPTESKKPERTTCGGGRGGSLAVFPSGSRECGCGYAAERRAESTRLPVGDAAARGCVPVDGRVGVVNIVLDAAEGFAGDCVRGRVSAKAAGVADTAAVRPSTAGRVSSRAVVGVRGSVGGRHLRT